ncbi:sensor histidine kinase [Haloarcula onubensis]|uniref:histidine kinase n=1 Tax=Haloarcula onubensis TaxID=2950539 RepID=A0ABU2FIW2_9EURY|nr:PAS domain-containing sensor histidine kinase [Halomicroarcula sp. S3CR25-11]MDS0280693.1 PAS domain-containing sensor histidine kinase [Halomicroarcula sp. S3CR25-11]
MRDSRGEKPHSAEESDGTISLEDIPLHSTNLLSLLDERGVIRYQSPSIERLLGFDQDELVGVPCTDCFHPDDREAVYAAFENVVASDEFVVEAIEYRHLTGDGSYAWVESVTSSNPTSNGYYVINTRDISVRKRQRKELERANERLKEFANTVSHDLQNPLGVARGRLRRVRQASDDEDLDAMVEPLDRMARMIDELRTLTARRRRAVETAPVPVASRAEAAWDTTETGDSDLRVLLDRETEYEADFGLLDHVFENLFRNAVVHNPGPVTVTVGPLADRRGFYVADDGTGIPSERADAVLEYGYSTAGAGTGVGLTIVSEFVEAQGWTLAVTDAEDGGARFEIAVE